MDHTIILFDIEYTAWEGSKARKWSQPWEHREIIQIAAIKMALGEKVVETGCFDCLVKPKCNPLLSPYITSLTGIQQSEMDAQGVGFAEALAAFYTFCEQGRSPLFCYGEQDPLVFDENYVLNNLGPPAFPAGMHDICLILEQAGIDTRLYTSGTVYQAVGIEFNLAAHNALNDVRSLALTLRHLIKIGKIGTDWTNQAAPEDH